MNFFVWHVVSVLVRPRFQASHSCWIADCCYLLSVCTGCHLQLLYLKSLHKNLLNVQSSVDIFGDYSLNIFCRMPGATFFLTWEWLLWACLTLVLSVKSPCSVSSLSGLWPGFPAVFSPPPPLCSLPNCSRGRSFLSIAGWWVEHISECKWVPSTAFRTFLWNTFSHPLSSRCHFISRISYNLNKECKKNVCWYRQSLFHIDVSVFSIFTTNLWFR